MKLFISYRSLDSDRVDSIVTRLRSLKDEHNQPRYIIWQDKDNIPAGKDWWEAIVDAIIDCDVFLFMVSHESVQSDNCKAELNYARKCNRPIVPIVLDGEFTYNTVKGKNDINYWKHIPNELNEARLQFLFYEGVAFVRQLETAFEHIQREPQRWRDIPALRPPDPRSAAEASNDTAVIYDEACDYAFRLELATAERLFQHLVNANDPDFGQEAYEWILILREYNQLLSWDSRDSIRYKVPGQWTVYARKFPKPFTPMFDPKGFQARFANGSSVTSRVEVQNPPIPTELQITRPRSVDLLPAPFAWIEIPRKGYSIAKYPVTNAQFRLFVEAGGYREHKWWTEDGWAHREEEGGTEPQYWADANFNGAAHPVVGVSWYESVAFCLWLSDVTGEKIMLPTEDQWQYAAQGDDGRAYPWGNKWDRTLCNNNVDQKGIGKTTPVQQYEGKGNSPFGVVDMAGNVWEWCLTDSENKTNDVNKSAKYRVLRGGSWYGHVTDDFRCGDRFWLTPRLRYNGRGFRLALS